MKRPNKNDTLNLVFSAFLVLGYIICSYFFLTMSSTKPEIEPYVNALVFVVFGLVLFYATRVGEGKQIARFSLATLLILDIPAFYIIMAQIGNKLPLHDAIANLGGDKLPYSPLFILAAVALGYGLPYTFFSGYEIDNDNADETTSADCAECEHSECVCDCSECAESETDNASESISNEIPAKEEFILADENTEGALMVIDDTDTEFDPEKEIRFSDVSSSQKITIGSLVIRAKAE